MSEEPCLTDRIEFTADLCDESQRQRYEATRDGRRLSRESVLEILMTMRVTHLEIRDEKGKQ